MCNVYSDAEPLEREPLHPFSKVLRDLLYCGNKWENGCLQVPLSGMSAYSGQTARSRQAGSIPGNVKRIVRVRVHDRASRAFLLPHYIALK